MDKNAIKKYAVWARTELITRVSQRAEKYDITAEADVNATSVNGVLLSDEEKKQRKALIEQVKQKGVEQVMEEVAYTWFNRFIALRFMEVNGYLPSHIRVFTDDNNEFKPQILAEAIHLELDGLDMEKVYEMKNANENDELYKYLIITQCNDLSKILPGMFQKISDYTELLFPDNILREGSVVEQMVAQIDEKDWDVSEGGQIEILGWLYQFYISEKHEAVVDPLHGKVVAKEEVPAATALFTTDWVVRYIIDNSVGRYWIERNPDSNLKNELEYFVVPKDGIIRTVEEKITPEDLTVLDPSMGSAHFGVYAFDVLMKIYMEYGVSERDAAASIVKNNLFGLDIDDRSAQIAYFAIMMKARQYDRRFFTRDIQPNFYSIQESNNVDSNTVDYFANGDSGLRDDISSILSDFKDAKEYGSIIKCSPVNYEALFARFEDIKEDISISKDIALAQLLPLVQTSKIMSSKYAVVATNPPYLNKYDSKLKDYITKYYKDYSGDLFSVFVYKNFEYCLQGGYTGFMTPFVWMFIKTYEKLRDYIITNKHIETLIQFEYSAFEEATVPICSFVLKNQKNEHDGFFYKLSDFKGGMEVQKQKVIEANHSAECRYTYQTAQENFLKIPGHPIAYWVPDYGIFDFPRLGDGYVSGGINKTHDNVKYLRNWWEIADRDRWQPYANGGDYRKWYGNHNDVVDWSEEAKNNYASHGGLYNSKFWGKQGVCWNLITSSKNGFRIKPAELHYSSGSPTIISGDDSKDYLTLGFLNTKIAAELIKMFNPTINTTVNDVLDLPIKCNDEEQVISCVKECIGISKEDWDLRETSYDFNGNPLIKSNKGLISEAYDVYKTDCNNRFKRLKELEEKINLIYINSFGLGQSYDEEVDDADITIRTADEETCIKELISYSVGCMFGRYSIEREGLMCPSEIIEIRDNSAFDVDKDGIIPICDDEYFSDDIVNRFVAFVKTAFGESYLEENLEYIAKALKGKGNPREVIRSYFINDFYKDHIKMYQKKPIYWLFDSGKKNGFKCLIYIHRYKEDMIARIRTEYVHELQSRYRTIITDLEHRIEASSTSDKVKYKKMLSDKKNQEMELNKYEEIVHHYADQMIKLDVNAGVKQNYQVIGELLAKVK